MVTKTFEALMHSRNAWCGSDACTKGNDHPVEDPPDFVHPSHAFKNIGWNAFYCRSCGLSDWESEGTGRCSGRRVWVCPTQTNGYTHGTCLRLFGTQAEAESHWSKIHRADAI